jgi:DNA-binding SARP family transcriptional activator
LRAGEVRSRVNAGRSRVREHERAPKHHGLLRIGVLGGFRVIPPAAEEPVSMWSRRSAKSLVKVLATRPEHALHREQIVEALWPGIELDSALNSFGKALHAARHALEPELRARASSQYLLFSDSMVSLDMSRVVVDADQFQALAEEALRCGDIGSYERALAAYGGDVLPEDRYEEWCADRRTFLAELRLRVLLELAEALEAQGFYNRATERLQEVIRQDPTRESVHRHLMRLYTQMEAQDLAMRQFRLCEQALRRDLGLAPQRETVLLYDEIVANRRPPETPSAQPASEHLFVGRKQLLQSLSGDLMRTPQSGESLIVLTGERGVGKTQVLEELAERSRRAGARILWGGSGARAGRFSCGPFAVALEGFAASRSATECAELAARYPLLAQLVPSLRSQDHPVGADGHLSEDHFALVAAIARLLADLSQGQPLLLVLGDLDTADPLSLDLIGYLARIRMHRRWMMVGALGDDATPRRTETTWMLDGLMRQGVCRKVELAGLSRTECDELVRAAVPDVQAGVLEEIFRLSAGNPLFVHEILSHMDASNVVPLSSKRSAPLTPSLSSRLRGLEIAQLSWVDRTTRRVLEMIAFGGRGVSVDQLRTWALALEPPVAVGELFDALDRALELRLVEEQDGSYVVVSPMVNAVLRAGVPIHRRQQLQGALSDVRSVRSRQR